MGAEERAALASMLRDVIFGLRHQPEISREEIAALIERDLIPLAEAAGVGLMGAEERTALIDTARRLRTPSLALQGQMADALEAAGEEIDRLEQRLAQPSRPRRA